MSARLILIGAGVAVAGLMMVPGVAPAVARASRPIVRRGMSAGAAAYEGVRTTAAEAYEHFEDLAAEVRAEMREAAETAEEAAGEAAEAAGDTAAGATGGAHGAGHDR
jgi:hypothetical protein